MKTTISVRLSDQELKSLESLRGKQSTSDYLRSLIAQEAAGNKRAVDDFADLLNDIRRCLDELKSRATEGEEAEGGDDSDIKIIRLMASAILNSMPAARAAFQKNHPELL